MTWLSERLNVILLTQLHSEACSLCAHRPRALPHITTIREMRKNVTIIKKIKNIKIRFNITRWSAVMRKEEIIRGMFSKYPKTYLSTYCARKYWLIKKSFKILHTARFMRARELNLLKNWCPILYVLRNRTFVRTACASGKITLSFGNSGTRER